MKKILIILALAYSYSFSDFYTTCPVGQYPQMSPFVQTYQGYVSASTCSFYFNGIRTDSNGHFIKSSCDTSTNIAEKYQSSRTCVLTKPQDYIDPDGNLCDYSIDGTLYCSTPPENGSFNEDGSINCNDGFGNLNGTCTELPPNSNGFEEDGTPICSTGYTNDNGSCIDDPSTNPDGTCKDGYTKIIGIAESGTCQPDSSSETGETGTGGDDETGTGGSTGGETGTGGDDETGTGGSTGGETGTGGDDDTGYTSGGGSGGTTGTDGNNTTPTEDEIPSENSSFICEDGAPSKEIESGFFSCDRTCESVGFVTNIETNKCQTSQTCPEGQTQTGTDLLGNPICIELSSEETNMTNLEKIASQIADNTSKNKNSNTQLGNLNNKVNLTNAKLESIKGGLSLINTSINNLDTTLKRNDNVTPTDTGIDLSLLDTTYEYVVNEYSTLETNLINHNDNLKVLFNDTKETLQNGFDFSLNSANVETCPRSYTLDLTSMNLENISLTIDICEFSSKLKPYLYPFFTIFLFSSVTFFAFKIITRVI